MASKHGSVCYSRVASVLLIFCLVSFTDSSESSGDLLEYTYVGDHPSQSGPAIHVAAFRSVRAKRQAGDQPTSPPVAASTTTTTAAAMETTVAPGASTPSSQTTTTTMSGGSTDSNTVTTTPTTTTTTPATTTTTPAPTPSVASTTSKPDVSGVGGSTTPQVSTLAPIIITDNHNYYTSTNIPGAADDYFVVLDNPRTHDSLNSAHRLAGVVKLPFTFRFYGHNVTSVTIATGGFLYMSPFLHKFLASTQYIAPLMANFHTAASNDSNIFFQHVGDEFVIEWQNITLKDEEDKGYFSFQAKLKVDGTITFVYKQLPVPLTNVSSESHPVKIGLSDAFYNDTHYPDQGIIRRRIIEYHRVVFYPEQVEEGTVIILHPLPTCNIIEDCKTCTRHENVKFDCKWCSNVGRCSDGLDWYRQDWENKGCKITAHADPSLCNRTLSSTTTLTPTTPTLTHNTTTTTPTSPVPTTTTTTTPTPTPLRSSTSTAAAGKTESIITTTTNTTGGAHNASRASQACRDGSCRGRSKKNTGVAAAVTVSVMLVILLIVVGVWVYYAYTHPTSSSGIWLMEHRPSVLRAKLANLGCCGKKPPASSKYAMESTA